MFSGDSFLYTKFWFYAEAFGISKIFYYDRFLKVDLSYLEGDKLLKLVEGKERIQF